MAHRPPRLECLFQEYATPLWFVTFNTSCRKRLLADPAVHQSFCAFCGEAGQRYISVGRYVLMPDHAHLFLTGPPDFNLAPWVRMLKLTLSSVLTVQRPHWQEGFFDHLIRHSESYSQKWEYVRQNPVRAGLVSEPEDWPYQGSISDLPFD